MAAPLAARADDAPKGERYALLVGVHKYSEAKELRPLPYAENDVTELARVLRDGGYKADDIVLMTQAVGADQLRYLPMKARILKELHLLLANRAEDDTVLLAFAGHGVVFKGDADSYFCPADAQLDDKDTLLSLTDVYRDLEGCKAGTKLLLVDACRNDPLADKSRASAKLDLDSVTRPPAPAKDGGVAAFFSCSRGQKAFEDDASRHGAFFHFVIEGLKGEASGGKDEVSLLELGAYVQRRVADFTRSEYGADQKPDMTNASTQGSAPLVQPPDFVKAYRRGKKLLEQKKYKKAEAEFTEALRLDPKYAPALKARGDAWNELLEYDRAIADCDAAIRIDANLAGAYTTRARAWDKKEEYAKAIDDGNTAVGLDPGDAWAFHNRGYAWDALGKHDRAIGDFDEAIRLAPKFALAFYNRGLAWDRKGELDKAIDDYSKCIRLDSGYTNALVNRSAAWLDKGENDKAIADCEAILLLEPQNPSAYYNRGVARKAKGDQDQADADFETARRLRDNK